MHSILAKRRGAIGSPRCKRRTRASTCRPCLAPGGLDISRDPEIERRLTNGLRAAGALARIGLDPEAFAIDRHLRPTPFPGLSSFGDEDADAALFYGRSREIADALEELRKVRAEGDLRPFVICGASGSGKSSLLKAGMIRDCGARPRPGCRCARSGPAVTRCSISPRRSRGHWPISGRVEAHGVLRDRLADAFAKAERGKEGLTPAGHVDLISALEVEGRKLREAAGRPGATILVSTDQAEELARADGDSGDALAAYLRAALVDRQPLAIRVIRTELFPRIAAPPPLPGFEGAGLRLAPAPAFRFDSVIEEPAQRYGVRVEPRWSTRLSTMRRKRTRCRCSPSACSAVGASTRLGRAGPRQLHAGRPPQRADRGRRGTRAARPLTRRECRAALGTAAQR